MYPSCASHTGNELPVPPLRNHETSFRHLQAGSPRSQGGTNLWREDLVTTAEAGLPLCSKPPPLTPKPELGSQAGGRLVEVVNRCVRELKSCLAAASDPAERELILRGLFDIYRWDVDYGGIAVGEKVPEIILGLATREEKELVAEWTQEAMSSERLGSRDYPGKIYGGFLLGLKGKELDDESFLTICRKTGRLQDLVA